MVSYVSARTQELKVLQEHGEDAMYLGGLSGRIGTSTLVSQGQIGIGQAKMRRKEYYKQRENSMPKPWSTERAKE